MTLLRKRASCAGGFCENLGPDVPLHFTAFHPDFKLQDKPRTPPETLHAARRIALDAGLHYVYEGNIYSDGAHTSCPACKTLLVKRSWHDVQQNRLKDGHCPKCGDGDSRALGESSRQNSAETLRTRAADGRI